MISPASGIDAAAGGDTIYFCIERGEYEMAGMEMTMVITEKIMEMVFLLLVGAVVYKTGIIDAAANKKVSNFLLMVISPALIISSYQMEYDVKIGRAHV